MNIEREYYENDGFWRDDSIRQEDLDRVAGLAARIPPEVASVLEVGCGNGIFANQVAESKRFRCVVGLDRSVAALRYVRGQRLCASIDAIPMEDKVFDCVAALEVIEHLPDRIFPLALAEMARLANAYILISVPYNEDLRSEMIECERCLSLFNPNYHMRSFDERRMHSLLDANGFSTVDVWKLGAFSRYVGVDRLRARRAGPKRNPFAIAIPCPMCGAELPGTGSAQVSASAPTAAPQSSGARSIVKRLWPREHRHNWIAGLYKRKAG